MREMGILAPVSMLPSNYGIGDFGKSAYELVDILSDNGVKLWQILPLNPVGFASSPYQPYSSYAGEEIYIDVEKLVKDGLLNQEDLITISKSNQIDYELVRKNKTVMLKKAYKNKDIYEKEITAFVDKNAWVKPYAKFITIKKHHNLCCWIEWEKEWQDENVDASMYQDDINYEIFVQYLFYRQWFELKNYANSKNIQIIGDIPIYVGIDSCDVWQNKGCFLLDERYNPSYIAGVPPDYFSATGQRWGNPIYDWDYLENHDFKFWIDRLKWSSEIYDVIRIDHFRAFDTYWKIPASCPTAIEGEWVEAPGYKLFDTIYEQIPDINIVVEDLGDLRKEVLELRDHYNLSGMKIVQFALDPNETNNDFEDTKTTILYTGTHDNQTLKGWFDSLNVEQQNNVKQQYCDYKDSSIENKIIHKALESVCDKVIIPLADILEYGDEARLNTPGTIGSPNWEYRLVELDLFKTKMSQWKKVIKEVGR